MTIPEPKILCPNTWPARGSADFEAPVTIPPPASSKPSQTILPKLRAETCHLLLGLEKTYKQ